MNYANAISAATQSVGPVQRKPVEAAAGFEEQTFRDSLLTRTSSDSQGAQAAPRPAPVPENTDSSRAQNLNASGAEGTQESRCPDAPVELRAPPVSMQRGKPALHGASAATKKLQPNSKSKSKTSPAELLQRRDAAGESTSGAGQTKQSVVSGNGAVPVPVVIQPSGSSFSVHPQAVAATQGASSKVDETTLRSARPSTGVHKAIATEASSLTSVVSAPETAQGKPELVAAFGDVVREHAGTPSSQILQTGSSHPIALLSSDRAVVSHTLNPLPGAPPSSLQAEQPGDARTLAATPNTLEVGVANGTHGWLRVRAELDQSGVVTAAVVASSASSAESLSRHLPEMSAYLAQESTRIGSLVVHSSAQSGAPSSQADGQSGFAAAGQFSGGQPGERSDGRNAGDLVQAQRRRDDDASSYDSAFGAGFASGTGSGMAAFPTWQNGAATHWVSVRV